MSSLLSQFAADDLFERRNVPKPLAPDLPHGYGRQADQHVGMGLPSVGTTFLPHGVSVNKSFLDQAVVAHGRRTCFHRRMSWDVVLILLLLGVVVPWRGFVRMRQLLAKPRVGSSERVLIYLGTIAFQWLAALVAAWRASAHGWSKFELGLVFLGDRNVLVAGLVGAAIVALLQGVNLRRMSRLPPESRARLGALAERILPQTPRERPLFMLLALTAGCCEEFLYRGFAMTAFSRAGLPLWSTIPISSVLFGLGHLYQGGRGAAGTAILGTAFGIARTAYGSIFPVACWHVAADVVAGMAGPKYLAGKPVTSSSPTSSDD